MLKKNVKSLKAKLDQLKDAKVALKEKWDDQKDQLIEKTKALKLPQDKTNEAFCVGFNLTLNRMYILDKNIESFIF